MPKYDDYTPHIYYGDEGSGNSGATAVTIENENESKAKKTRTKSTAGNRSKSGAKVVRNNKTEKESGSFIDNFRAFFASRTTAVVTGIILAGLAAYFLISFISYIGSCISDQSIIYNHPVGSVPTVSNQGGEGGARLSELFINRGFGLGAFVLVIWLVCISLKLLIGKPRFRTLDFTIKCLIGFVTLSLIIGLITIGSNSLINWGGYHGRYVNEWIIGFLGWAGAGILCIVMIALFVTICMRDVVKWVMLQKRAYDARRRERAALHAEELAKARDLAEQQKNEQQLDVTVNEDDEKGVTAGGLSFESGAFYPETEEEVKPFYDLPEEEESTQESQTVEYTLPEEPEEKTYNEDEVKPEEKKTETTESENVNPEPISGLEAPMVVNVNQIAQGDENTETFRRRSQYHTPSLSLLEDRDQKINVNADEQLANKERIRQTLQEYGIPITSIEAHVGPTVTLYEIRPDKGQRIARIKGLVDEIALSLAAKGVRIIAPIPGKGTIGIEVANIHPQTVSLKSILGSRKYQETHAQLPLALGSTISNDVYIADLASIPHLLVAGATGKGKSVGLNVIIMSLLFKLKPNELKFVMFDPKMVEFNLYAAIEKQYLAKLPDAEEAIITDMSKVVPTLNSLCIEMDNRYKLLKEVEVRKLDEYNALVKKGVLKDKPNHRFLPYIVVVVDEFADLIMTAGKEVEMPIARLAQKARAVGIHVIIATQRPSATVITGNIKNNFTGRMAFQVSTGIDSKVILDTTGAQQLIGKGDMLIMNNSELVRVQCAFIDTPEVKAVCEHISEQPYPIDSPYILPEPEVAERSETVGSLSAADKDPLFDEIKEYIIASGVASTSNIQRKYQLGYNRAGRIMDQLEAEGIVGPSQGGKARQVLV